MATRSRDFFAREQRRILSVVAFFALVFLLALAISKPAPKEEAETVVTEGEHKTTEQTSFQQSAGSTESPAAQTLIDALALQPHIEGGYYRRTFQADHRAKINVAVGPRYTLTSIYYMVTRQSPIGHWHLNKSDIIHYFHSGSPINYYMIDAEGELHTATLGPDVEKGQQFQLVVKGGTWKASFLPVGEYGLISEAVAPGFEYEDMQLGEQSELLQRFPQHAELIARLSRPVIEER